MFHLDGGIFAVLGVLFDGFTPQVQPTGFRTYISLIINRIIRAYIIHKHCLSSIKSAGGKVSGVNLSSLYTGSTSSSTGDPGFPDFESRKAGRSSLTFLRLINIVIWQCCADGRVIMASELLFSILPSIHFHPLIGLYFRGGSEGLPRGFRGVDLIEPSLNPH